jgi:regulator of PEP synthase PpsR (kinase-PPPase family)
MGHKYQISLISDSTGEKLNRIFLAPKSRFSNFDYEKKEHVFIRTESQIDKVAKDNEGYENFVILYTVVETRLAKYISNKCNKHKILCFSILGSLILNFSKLLNQKATHIPSAQYVLDDNYYKKIEAIQFLMAHDDGTHVEDIENAVLILLGVSRTSKTPTSIYLANRGHKTLNIPITEAHDIPNILRQTPERFCVVGISVEAGRLFDTRTNRLEIMKKKKISSYSNLSFIQREIESSKKIFKKYNWLVIDATEKICRRNCSFSYKEF